MYYEHKQRTDPLSVAAVIIIAAIAFAAIVGNIYTYQLFSNSVKDLQSEVETLQTQVLALRESVSSYNQTSIGNISLSELYETVRDSVVLIRGYVAESEVSGSGFIYNFSGSIVIVTNFHVVEDAAGLTVSFRNGNSYAATVLGSDPYADFAVLSVDALAEFKPLPISSSSLLNVGDLVIAVGNPYGLTGSMTTGIVSQLGRTITEPMTGNYPIANVIQISTPINPGNSGGPLLNSRGQVVGITTAVITQSQGIGFAIPSDTILREIAWLVNGNEYVHPWVGVAGRDMTYEIAQAMNVNVTYGWLIAGVTAGSPADGVLRGSTRTVVIYGQDIDVGGDVIIALNGTRIVNGDGVSSYLETYTLPGSSVDITIIRSGTQEVVSLRLGERPAPS